MASGNADRLAGPAVPPAMMSRPPPATQPRSAAICSLLSCVEFDVLPDQAIERAPRLDTRRQVGGIEADSQRLDVVHVGQQVQVADDVARSFRDDGDHHLGPVVDRVRRLGGGDRRLSGVEADLELTPETRRLRVQAMGLVGLGRRLDEGPEARPPLRPARDAQLAHDRWAVVLEPDVDGHPRPDTGMPIEHDGGLHRQAGGRGHRGHRPSVRRDRGRDETGRQRHHGADTRQAHDR